jgi:hypothetical protein
MVEGWEHFLLVSAPAHCDSNTELKASIMTLAFNPHRAKVFTAALLAAPPPNSWTRPVLFHTCTRHVLVAPCQAAKFGKPQKASGSSFGKDHSYGSSSTNSSRSGSFDGSSRDSTAGLNKHKGSPSSNSSGSSSSSRQGSRTQTDRQGSNRSGPYQQQRGTSQRQPGSQYSSGGSQRPGGPNSNSSGSRSVSRAVDVAPPVSSPVPKHAPLLVVGAGAAGLTAAYFAAKQGAQVGRVWLNTSMGPSPVVLCSVQNACLYWLACQSGPKEVNGCQ